MSKGLQYLTDQHGDRTGVVLPLSEYEQLLEDLDDLGKVAAGRGEPVMGHEDFMAELKRDGVL